MRNDLPVVLTQPIDASKIAFFFGAGASIEFGIPSMRQMTSNFADEVRKKEHEEEEKEAFDIIYNSLEKVYGKDKVDLEAIMSVIIGLKDKERVIDNIGDFGLFMLERKGVTNPANGSEYKTKTLDKLENEFKTLVRNKVVILEPQKIDLLRTVYFDFFKQICANCTNCSNIHSPDSDPNKYTHDSWTFFTTNYDNALEDFWVNHRKYRLMLVLLIKMEKK